LPLQQLFQQPQPALPALSALPTLPTLSTLVQEYQPSISGHEMYPSFTTRTMSMATTTSANMVMPGTGDALAAPIVVTDAHGGGGR